MIPKQSPVLRRGSWNYRSEISLTGCTCPYADNAFQSSNQRLLVYLAKVEIFKSVSGWSGNYI
jgi:hypothetical protein